MYIVELDPLVAAVWETILEDAGGGEWLANQIVAFDLTLESVKAELAKTDLSIRQLAFQAILKNRVNRGGIMAPGAGLVKTGEAGKGLRSRWYPETLYKRILEIVKLRDKISFIHGDGLAAMQQYAKDDHVVFFIDPPYTVSSKRAGSRLYTYPDIDHVQLFKIANELTGDFLITLGVTHLDLSPSRKLRASWKGVHEQLRNFYTYDDAEEVREMAQQYDFDTQTVAMKNTHNSTMQELLIGRNLDWIR